MTATLTATTKATIATRMGPRSSTTAKSMDMPTATKNRPMRTRFSGATLTSTWWRKSEAASIMPSRNPPMAMDRPATSMTRAAPRTASSTITPSAAVDWARAVHVSTSGSTYRPTTATPATAAAPAAPSSHNGPSGFGAATADSSGTAINSGTAARSCMSRTANAPLPWSLATSPFSSRVCMTIAVEESARPNPTTMAAFGEMSASASRAPARMAPVTRICREPSPRSRRRMDHSLLGRISRPMVNMNSTTPISATARSSSTWVVRTTPGECGPSATPAASRPRIEPSLSQREMDTKTMLTPRTRIRAQSSSSRFMRSLS